MNEFQRLGIPPGMADRIRSFVLNTINARIQIEARQRKKGSARAVAVLQDLKSDMSKGLGPFKPDQE